MNAPMSGRSIKGELAYQEAKMSGNTLPLEQEPSVRSWSHWRMIRNRFPYDMLFMQHDMLIPIRSGVADRWQLNDDEKAEFELILREFVYPNYDLWFENCPKRRSVLVTYHIHLATYKEER